MSNFYHILKKIHNDIDTFFNKDIIIEIKRIFRIIIFATILPCYITYKYTDWHWRYIKMASAKVKWQYDKEQALKDLEKKITNGKTHERKN